MMEKVHSGQSPAARKEVNKAEENVTSRRPPAVVDLPETGGPKGLDPTRYGDWEIKGKCVDF